MCAYCVRNVCVLCVYCVRMYVVYMYIYTAYIYNMCVLRACMTMGKVLYPTLQYLYVDWLVLYSTGTYCLAHHLSLTGPDPEMCDVSACIPVNKAKTSRAGQNLWRRRGRGRWIVLAGGKRRLSSTKQRVGYTPRDWARRLL